MFLLFLVSGVCELWSERFWGSCNLLPLLIVVILLYIAFIILTGPVYATLLFFVILVIVVATLSMACDSKLIEANSQEKCV
jgi:hypothetical protein